MSYDHIIIGGGLSGLAAGIRLARFGFKVLILEQHSRPGGLNSYYYRQGRLFETGLHAMTNFADPGKKDAPLNRLFRQLKLSRKAFATLQQQQSTILFPGDRSLRFTNDPQVLIDEVARLFPESAERFRKLVDLVVGHDPFQPRPFASARKILTKELANETLADMLLWPLMMYGNSCEHDMDFDQFVIMFQSIFLEGFFRPEGTIKDFIDLLLNHYRDLGGEIRYLAPVKSVTQDAGRVRSVVLASGEELAAKFFLSTAGYPATLVFLGQDDPSRLDQYSGKMSFVELIYLIPSEIRSKLRAEDTIIFYNFDSPFDYCCPDEAVNVNCGVICFPENFQDLTIGNECQVRVTHPANYHHWKKLSQDEYYPMKSLWAKRSEAVVGKIIGNYSQNIVYQDSFTPITIERYTGKVNGAIYGSPEKIRDGRTSMSNLFVAGTDQGYLGIVGAMLSGVTMVNQHLLQTSEH
ncbi:MAG: FAD-dependent oxidoreductase [Proteobacteria bacterium]|nr:FAD-dependent oxidoreductase [Pseudomonadota bacterium]MBU1686556.1 FAD-dependent oxidoreductase [Pseudomonadota bacterium]